VDSPNGLLKMLNDQAATSTHVAAARATLSEIGVAIDKQYILNMWKQGLNVEIEPNIRIIDAESKRSYY
jgi:hypothetical protein